MRMSDNVRRACAKGRDALASLWAAIGDRLCAGKPLDEAYAKRVAEECRAASRALEDAVSYADVPIRAALAALAAPVSPVNDRVRLDAGRLIGTLLDAWDGVPNDERPAKLERPFRAIYKAIDDGTFYADPAPVSPPA